MRLTLVISSLSAGGAERVMSTLANYWATKGEEITLVTLASEATDFYDLHPGVGRVALGLAAESANPWKALWSNLRRVRSLREEIRASAPDVVISFIHRVNVLTLLACLGMDIPVVVSERIDATKFRIGRIWSGLRRLLYPRAGAVVAQSEDMRRWVLRFVRDEKAHIIPNPVSLPAYEPEDVSFGDRTVIAVGRLAPQKGFDLLMRAFAYCAPERPGWSLTILGEGAERGNLEALASGLGIADRVSMPGEVAEPASFLRRAGMFVMSSRYEGFPNALLEAMSCGLPVVSFDCPSGPREIVRDGVDGVLVENGNVEALAAAMRRLMSDEAERERLGSRAVEVTERFGLEKVVGLWEDVLNRAMKRRGNVSAHAKQIASGERFGFGENWSRFLEVLDEERISEAEKSLKNMLDVENLRERSFLDLGSGSGLFSLAARRLGARVHSLDYDPESVACTRELRRRYFPDDEEWTVEEGDALDREYIESLGRFDVVYSWGVLHHTGDMWLALENAIIPVDGGGRLFVAIYNDQGGKSRRWRRVKQLYISGDRGKKLVSAVFIPYFVLGGLGVDLLRRKDPRSRYREYKKSRGMSRVHDWHDWLGGYPFEVAKPEEVFEFYRKKGFALDKLITCGGGLGNNQFVFTRREG